ncbi:separin-like isoform X1 [Octopus vulgaris]|uniref:separase n=1 Tax=Octopus vulgaris TaxID=6645 RepID=A0AA36APG3_OCTVU|nr:separin-like isoform X1 [Octopus vulgaris]
MHIFKDTKIHEEGKDIIQSLKNRKCKEVYAQLKDYLLQSSESSNDTTLKYYGHFVVSVLRTSVTSIKEDGPQPTLLSIVDLSYNYFKKLQKHIKLTDPCFISKIFHVVLACITKVVDYVDYVLKFSELFYTELIELKSTNQDVSTLIKSPYLLNFAVKLEMQKEFTNFQLTLGIRHMALKLLTLNNQNISLLVSELGRTFERYRKQNNGNSTDMINCESAEIWDNILKCVHSSLLSEQEPNKFLTDVLELHIHHARFIYFYGKHYQNSKANFKKIQSFLQQNTKKGDNLLKGLTCLCDAILLLQQHETKDFDINFLFNCIENVNSKLKGVTTEINFSSNLSNLINDAYGIFIDCFSQWEPFKTGQLEKNMFLTVVELLDMSVSVLHKKPDEAENNNANRTGKYNVFIRNTYVVYMEVLYSLIKTDDAEEWLYEAERVARIYFSEVTHLYDVTKKILEKHLIFIGQWLRNFGRFCYINGYNKPGIGFYELSIDLLSIQETYGENVEQSYIKTYEYLAEFYKRCGNWEKALKTVISCLCINTDAAMVAALKMWIRIKKEHNKDSDLTNKTLKTYVEENVGASDKAKINLNQLLEKEWQMYQSSSIFRKSQRDLAISMLTELSKSAATTYQQCFYLYELAQLLWLNTQKDGKCGKDYLLEAIELMTPLFPSASSKEKILFGQANLLLYIFEHEDFCQKCAKGFKSDDENIDLDKVSEENQFQLSLKREFDLMEKLELFLEIFEKLFDDKKTFDDMPAIQITQILQTLLLANSIYTLTLKPLHSLRILTVALQLVNLSANVSVELRHKIILHLCSTLSSFGAVEAAWSILNAMSDPASDASKTANINSEDSETMSSLLKMLTHVELFLKQKQFTKGIELNQKVASHEIFQTNKTKLACAILGFSKRLLSKLKLVPATNSDCSDNSYSYDESPLEFAYESVRMYSTIVQYLNKPNNVDSYTCAPFADIGCSWAGSFDALEKWELVSNLLESLLHLSLIYCYVGDEREAKCFIKEGIKLSYILALPRWNATFQILLARINLLSNKIESAAKAMKEAKNILLTQENVVSRKIYQENMKKLITNTSPHSINVSTPEMFTMDDQLITKFRWSAELSDEETIMRKDNTCIYESTPLKVADTTNVTSQFSVDIPVLDNEDHKVKCGCHCCSDVVSQDLFLKYLVTQAELEQLTGNDILTENILTIAEDQYLKSCKHIKTNLEGLLQGKSLSCLLNQMCSENFKVTPENSLYINNCLFTLSRSYLVRCHLAENCSQFQLCYEYAKKGLLIFQSNHLDFSNPEVLYLHTGLTICLSNALRYVSDFSDIEEIISPDPNLDVMTLKLSNMTLQSETVSSGTIKTNIDKCVQDMEALSIIDKADNKTKRNAKKSVCKSRKEGMKSKSKNDNQSGEYPTTVLNNETCMSVDSYKWQSAQEKFKDCMDRKTKLSASEIFKDITAEHLPSVYDDDVIAESETGEKSVALDVDNDLCERVVLSKKLKTNKNIPEVCPTKTECSSKCETDNFVASCTQSIPHESSASSVYDILPLPENESLEKDQIPSKLRDKKRQPKVKTQSLYDSKLPQKLEAPKSLPLEVSTIKVNKRSSRQTKSFARPKSAVSNQIINSDLLPESHCDFESCQDSEPTSKQDSPLKKSHKTLKSRPTRLLDDQSIKSKITSESQNKEECKVKKTSSQKSKIPSKIIKPLCKVENNVIITKTTARCKSNPIIENLKSKGEFESNVYNFDEKSDNESGEKKVIKRRGRPPKKAVGWQSRLAEASNVIAREHRRSEVTNVLVDKIFSMSPERLSVAKCNNIWQSLPSPSFAQHNTSFSSDIDSFYHPAWKNAVDAAADDDDPSLLGDTSFGNLSVSSSELVRAAEDSDSSSECKRKPRVQRKPTLNREKLSRKYKTPSESEKPNSEYLQKIILENAYMQTSHFPPCSLHSCICKSLAVKCLPENPTKAAFYLNESQAVTLRHNLAVHLNRKIRRLLKDPSNSEDVKKQSDPSDQNTLVDNLRKAKTALKFGQKKDIIPSLIEAIHQDLTVCQVSVIHPHHDVPYLIVTRYRNSSVPTVISLSGYGTTQGKMVSKTFNFIQRGNRNSFHVLDKKHWWNTRHKLDKNMESVVNKMENLWLHSWKGILLGQLTNEEDQNKLKMLAVNVQKTIQKECQRTLNLECIEILIDSGELLSDECLESAVIDITGLQNQDSRLQSIKSLILRHCKNLNSSVAERHPVTLILDKEIQHLPWENMPILRKQAVTRIPSLYYLKIQKKFLHNQGSILTDGIDRSNTYYVLNPDANLQHTQETFKDWFQSIPDWEGVVGQPPTADQFISALTQKDVMIYCGHGSGSKYLHGDHLQNLNCHAAAILMGCSSGYMEAKGVLDECGMITNYYLAFCPMIVANLWDVTDKDIDRFLQAMLKSWISVGNCNEKKDCVTLTKAVVKARDACRLTYLIGCAPVVYGLPL